MGAVYDVELNLKYRSAQDVVDATRNFVDNFGKSASFSDADFTDIRGALECIFTKRGLHVTTLTDTTAICDSGFDASYGWETVMTDWFDYTAAVLEDGSEFKIWPDNGYYSGVVNNGKVNWSELEEEDEDDDWSEDDSGSGSGMKVDDAVLQEAIDCINDFSLHEYDDFAVDNNTDLSDIDILYTTDGGDGEVELQVSVDLINPAMKYYINGELRNTDTYADLEDLIASDLADLDFQSLFEYGVQFAKKSDYDPEVSQYYIDMREE
jgi:hypothetical protein